MKDVHLALVEAAQRMLLSDTGVIIHFADKAVQVAIVSIDEDHAEVVNCRDNTGRWWAVARSSIFAVSERYSQDDVVG